MLFKVDLKQGLTRNSSKQKLLLQQLIKLNLFQFNQKSAQMFLF